MFVIFKENKYAEFKKEQRHVNYVGFDIATVPDLFTDDPPDPTFEQVFQNLGKQDLRGAYQTLSDDDHKLLVHMWTQ